MSAEPRIRVSALLRWRDRILLCRHEKPGKEYWLLPGGGVEVGREPRRRAAPRARARRSGIDDELPFEGPVAIVDSIAPERQLRREARRPHHLRRRPRGRSLEAVTSADAAVRGHRLFALGELDEIVAAPADPALPRPLAAGRPGRLPRRPVGAVGGAQRARMLDLVDRRGDEPAVVPHPATTRRGRRTGWATPPSLLWRAARGRRVVGPALRRAAALTNSPRPSTGRCGAQKRGVCLDRDRRGDAPARRSGSASRC